MTISGADTRFPFPWRMGNTNYEYDYFAGSSVLTYFEEILVEDTCRIAWNVQQGRVPVYGYASQYFNALAAGNVIVNGSIWVYFKEAAYMPTILRHVAARKDPEGDSFYATPAQAPYLGTQVATTLDGSSREWGSLEGNPDTRQAGRVQRANIERILEARENSDGSETNQRELQNLLLSLGALSDREFEDVAEVFEDALWYGGNSNRDIVDNSRGQLHQNNFAGGDMTDVQWLGLRRADQYPPFDIMVTYGDINNGAANHTVHRILDVSFVNSEVAAIQANGEPVIIRYDFLARNAV